MSDQEATQSAEQALREIIAELGIEEEEITPGARLRSELGLDSTETVEIALAVKRRFGVEVKLVLEDDLDIESICQLVEEARAAQAVGVD
jgi:acyl carrier protein